MKYYATGLKVLEQDWNAKTGYVKDTHPLAKAYNAKIRGLRNKVEEHFLAGGTFANFIANGASEKHALLPYLSNFIADGEKGLLGLREGTLKNYRATLKRLGEYEELTSEFERSFSSFLRNHAGCRLPGIGKHMKNLKRENIFIREGQAFLQYKSIKTGQETILPAAQRVLDILEK